MEPVLRRLRGLRRWWWVCTAVLLSLTLVWVWASWTDSKLSQPVAARAAAEAAAGTAALLLPAPDESPTIGLEGAGLRANAGDSRLAADPCHAEAPAGLNPAVKSPQPPAAQAIEARLSQLRQSVEQRPRSPSHPIGAEDSRDQKGPALATASTDRSGSTNHLGQLAALALQASLQAEHHFNASRPAAACDRNDAVCRQGAQQRYQMAIQSAYASAAEQGRELALRSGEPAALQMALHLCAASGPFVNADDRRECSLPLLQAWVGREADNTTPWLMLSALERETGNRQAADEALYRASIASRLADGAPALWGLMASPAFAPDGGAAAADLQQRWAAIMAALSYSSLGNVASLCSESAVKDGNLHQRCDAIAQRMVGQGGQMIHRVEGLAIAHRLGWPEERLSTLRAQVHQLLKADSAELQAQAAAGPCRSLQAQRTRALQTASQGEVARLQAQAARSK